MAPLVVRFALNLKYLASSVYRTVRQSGIISLPSERTLADDTHWTHPHAGAKLEFEQFHILLLTDSSTDLFHSALNMDEMKIKSRLVFKHTGCLTYGGPEGPCQSPILNEHVPYKRGCPGGK